MTRILLIFTLFLLSCQNDLIADSDEQAVLENDFQFELMADYLNITDEQRSTLISLRNGDHHKAGKHGRRASMKAMFETLNEAQKEKLIQLKNDMKSGEIPNDFVELKKSKMINYLELDEKQSTQFSAIFDEAGTTLRSWKTDSKRSKENVEAMKAFKESFRSKMESILSDEQYAKWERINRPKQERKEKRFAEMRDRKEKVAQELGLSDEQKEKLIFMKESHRDQIKAVFESELTKEQKHEKLKLLKDQFRVELNIILTQEQQQKLDKLENDRPHFDKRRHRF